MRDATGKILQLAYGETNIDPACSVKVGDDQEVCDISRIVAKLNMEYETSKK